MTYSYKVSVLTRTYNRPLFLSRAAEHLSAQTLENFEWIIINDGGNVSACEQIIEPYITDIDIRIIHNKRNQGRGASAAIGIEQANGAYSLIHDDDDWLSPTALSQLCETLDANPESVAVTCGHTIHNEEVRGGKIISMKTMETVALPYPPSLQDIAYKNSLLTISTLFRTEAALKCGNINPKLDVLEDWELWLRLLIEGDISVCQSSLAHQSVRTAVSREHAQSNRNDHLIALTKIRNHYLRQDIKQGRASLGMMMNPHNRHEFDRLDLIFQKLARLRKIFRR